MTATDNPMGLEGFEFVEFCAPEPGAIEPVFERLGFVEVARHRSKDVHLWRQNDVNFIVNYEPGSLADYYAEEHGPSACGMAFRVRDAHHAYERALSPRRPAHRHSHRAHGAAPAGHPRHRRSALYLIDRYQDGSAIYDIDFRYLDGVERRPRGAGLGVIDHLTHNVYRGRMDYWARFYEKLFDFREIRHFDIRGQQTGLTSRAMTAPDGKIRIPLNEEAGHDGQIEEFLMAYNGEGIQHIAFACDDLIAVWDDLHARGVPFMTPPPDSYYEMLEERLPGHGEPVDELQRRGILLDGSTAGGEPRLLLQIFSETLIGPIFFEFIQRKRDEGFGEGNFQALFESMERDQLRRGALGQREAAAGGGR
jgi:4-hydroxyphenylpyruvate dioxygenase